jgi:hypothetical protein
MRCRIGLLLATACADICLSTILQNELHVFVSTEAVVLISIDVNGFRMSSVQTKLFKLCNTHGLIPETASAFCCFSPSQTAICSLVSFKNKISLGARMEHLE